MRAEVHEAAGAQLTRHASELTGSFEAALVCTDTDAGPA